VLNAFNSQWQRYDATLRRPPAAYAGSYWTGVNVLRASLDKTFTGAAAAGLASPWGQAVPAGNAAGGLATYFGSYRETFSRDAYETFTGFLTDGDLASARAITTFLFDRQQLASGAFPRNSLTNGKAAPDTGGLQLDETAYPILMAWQSGLGGDRALYTGHVRPAAEFLVAHGASGGVERWEEQSGYSPSTIAAEIAGLVAAGAIARENGDQASARVFDATADAFQRSVTGWTVTTNGPDSTQPYFIRLSKTGDPNAAISYNLGNGGPTLDQRSVIDQGFLELTRLGELPGNLPVIANSLAVTGGVIASPVPSGTGYHRYNGDGYGDASGTGQPWATTDTGTGHLWPVLSGERGEQDLSAGDMTGARAALSFMQRSASGVGLIPEQVWEQPDLPASPYGSDPGLPAYDYSTTAAYPSRNYTVSPGWSQSIEVDGFGRAQWQTALGTSAGTIAAVSGDPADGLITITVPSASLGAFGSGWSVAVALYGQDGFGTDDARAFTSVPGDFTFGVCAGASADPACQVSPSIEPEVMDTIAGSGVSVASELNVLSYPGNTTTTLATPVVLQGVTVP
jgi:glucoamylase